MVPRRRIEVEAAELAPNFGKVMSVPENVPSIHFYCFRMIVNVYSGESILLPFALILPLVLTSKIIEAKLSSTELMVRTNPDRVIHAE